MKKIGLGFIFVLFLVLGVQAQHQRFPKPEFETGYEQPSHISPEPRGAVLEWVDVLVLLAVLSLATWLLLRKRSRRGILWLSVFTLLYFGFYRNGCICSVGSIQNIAYGLFHPGYKIGITVLLFFLLPLVFALFFGRTFCAAACPLGAIQDLLVLKPLSLSPWLRKTISFIPHLYLGFAILFAATGTDFIICRYDPFIGIFRMDAPFTMIVLGVAMLLLGLFFARPYCRAFCPYGVLLGWMSKFSKKHMTISPAECISCHLCNNSCPFDAIDKPSVEKERSKDLIRSNVRRYVLYAIILPIWMVLGAVLMGQAHVLLSKAHPDVYLAELLITHPELKADTENLDIQGFLESGRSMEDLLASAKEIRSSFKTGSKILGGYLGLVLGVMLMNQLLLRRREQYEPNKNDCFSCGRCMSYCPVEKEEKE